jgi:hypothetical protein
MRTPGATPLALVADRLREVRARAERLQGQPGRTRGYLPIIILVVALLVVVALVEQYLVLGRALGTPGFGMLGRDAELYLEATRQWLGGGPYYLPDQLAGPYDLPWGQILYPPQALALFVPFTVIGTPLFILIPVVVTAAVVLSYRPKFWAWIAILVVLVLHPDAPLPWIAGTPTIWFIMLVALATRWPWVSAFIWFKPSVFPFALIGIRDRRWWIVSIAFAVSAVVMWPFMQQWITAVLNARGENSGLLYSLTPTALAGPAIVILAWLGRTRPLPAAATERPA